VIFGWDTSDYDHERGMRAEHIAAGAREGITFFTHKATEQTPKTVFEHRHFGEKVHAARDAGMPFIGAYVVARTGVPETDQAAFLLDPPTGVHRFFWQVDLEHWEHDKVEAIVGERLAEALELATGHRAVIYAPRWAYGDGIPGDRPLWNSDYRGSGEPGHFLEQWRRVEASTANTGFAAMSGREPRILQYASDAVIGGQHTCDANVFRGTAEEFAGMITLT
jgi:hypothetical protein